MHGTILRVLAKILCIYIYMYIYIRITMTTQKQAYETPRLCVRTEVLNVVCVEFRVTRDTRVHTDIRMHTHVCINNS